MAKTDFIAEPGKQEVIVKSVFEAPRKLVFKTCTDPELLPSWWGPEYFTTVVETMDVKPGGIWRYVQKDAKGKEYAFNGVYHSIVPPERLVQTSEFEGTPGHVCLVTMTFDEMNGKTTLVEKWLFQSVEDRDGRLKADMEKGAKESMDRLEGILTNFLQLKI